MDNKKYISDIESLEELNEVRKALDVREKEIMFEASLKNLEERSFNCIKESFEEISPMIINEKKGKALIKKYTNTIKESKNLKTLHRICEAVRVADKDSDASKYISDIMTLSETLDVNYKEDVKRLGGILAEACRLVGNLDSVVSEKDMNEAIEYMASHRKDIRNLVTYNKNSAIVESYIKENGNTYIPLKKDSAIDGFNNQYEKLSESEKKVVRAFNEGKLEDAFNEALKECAEALSKKLKTASGEERTRLEKIQEGVKGKCYIESTVREDINNFMSLASFLNE